MEERLSASVASEGGLKLVRGLRVAVLALKPNVGLPEDIISRISQDNCEIEHYLILHRLIRTKIVQTQLEVHTLIHRAEFVVQKYLISKLGEDVSCFVTSIGIDV